MEADAGVPLVEGYGLTESAPVAIANPVTIDEWSGQIGVPLPSTDAAILDDDGKPVAWARWAKFACADRRS